MSTERILVAVEALHPIERQRLCEQIIEAAPTAALLRAVQLRVARQVEGGGFADDDIVAAALRIVEVATAAAERIESAP